MPQTFYPDEGRAIKLEASRPHPPGTEYVVSVGSEVWGSHPHRVIKVQISYDGKIEGRKSVSYPVGTDDFHRVNYAVNMLTSDACTSCRNRGGFKNG